jgi:integrase
MSKLRLSKKQTEYVKWRTEWVESLNGRLLSDKTVTAYLAGLSLYWKWLDQRESLDGLSVKNLRKALARCPKTKIRCRYSQRIQTFNAVKLFIDFLIDEEVKPDDALNKVKKCRPTRVTDSHRPRLDDVQESKLFATHESLVYRGCQKQRLDLMFLLYERLGLRASEMADLKWEDINEPELEVYILGKGNKGRHVPLDPRMIPILHQWKMDHWVLGQTVLNNWTANAMKIAMQRLRNAAGLDINLHGLRRTAADKLYDGNVDINDIKEFLGHDSITTTELYLRKNSKRAKRNILKHWATLDQKNNVLDCNQLG